MSRRLAIVLSLIVMLPACMLITSPGDFSIVDGSTQTVEKNEAGDGSGGACSNINAPLMCETCLEASCCSAFTDCENDPACEALLQCASGDTSCENDNMAGEKHAAAYVNCLTTTCPICTQEGIGDPCGGDAGTCAATLTCNGLFCTKSCAGDDDCAGIYADGENSSGEQNRCIINGENAAVCFPGCGSTTDCEALSNAICVTATASISGTTLVCAAAGIDGGLDGDVDATDDGEVEDDASEDAFVDAGTDAVVDSTVHGTKEGGSDAASGG